jgi:2-octaprenyl-6-methoxyphenol hydroxylase
LALLELPPQRLAPIRTVVVSSSGEFGRAVIGEDDVGGQLGATIRYGDLLEPLAAAAGAEAMITIRRPLRVTGVRQENAQVEVECEDGERVTAPLSVNAEGLGTQTEAPHVPQAAALVADVEVEGAAEDCAFERFTRDGPLALLPVAGRAASPARPMALIWCMPSAAADRRHALSDAELLAEVQRQLGSRNGRLRAMRARGRVQLAQQARDRLHEHRVVYLGNAAQALHPVAGQGLNLGLRDCVALADCVGDPYDGGLLQRLEGYGRRRRADRSTILALTRTTPALFATRFAPVAFGRSLGLTLLSIVPDLRREFARLLMFGVRL